MTFMPSEGQQTTRPTRSVLDSQKEKRTKGEDAAPAPGHSRDRVPDDFRTIAGWGADLDPANRPAVPRELPSDVRTVRGDVRHRQQPRGKIHMSNEMPDLTPVFGDTLHPHGLSGMLRDYAYEFGEATNRHWMTLMLADRVDTWESAIADLLTGRYAKEKGWTTPHITQMDEKTKRTYLFTGAAFLGMLALGVALSRARK